MTDGEARAAAPLLPGVAGNIAPTVRVSSCR